MNLGREQAYLTTASLVTLAAVAVAFVLYWMQALLIPFVLSILVAYLVRPIVDLVHHRLRAPRWLAILIAFVVVGVGSGVLLVLLWTSVQGLADNADVYRDRITALGTWGLAQLEHLPDAWVPEAWRPETLDPEAVFAELDVGGILQGLGTQASNLLAVAADLLSNTLLVVLFSVYLLSAESTPDAGGTRNEIDQQVRRYLGWKFVLSGVTGLLTWLILAIMGLDLAMVFGVLAFLLNFIPSLGSIIATLLPLPIALFQFDSGAAIAASVVLPGIVQFTIGNVIEPKVMGDSLDMHPITVLLTLIFWGLLWGAVGMVLAVPLTSVVKIVLARFETTRPVAELLAGRFVGWSELEAEAATTPGADAVTPG
ncbi:MAG: AI-2E family transporter [Alphaproteobacteria bacterium]|nr:AI-2E family transporter [Alphaproteobacteria bacterium]